jgi:DNA processing protein
MAAVVNLEASDSLRARVISLLSPTPVELDDLVREAKAPPELVLGVVMELELSGKLLRQSGGKVLIAK